MEYDHAKIFVDYKKKYNKEYLENNSYWVFSKNEHWLDHNIKYIIYMCI